ncbi:hypothetical protein BDV93DRAFT_610728 [Ceratobasidium sp. AG-I]|nr:hypothetical protein BDV93DRAFT_610728 [Ceratobasidium sp. AG-I]
MGRKKGGKNPEGHRAGGARSGAGRPRKAGPLTLKASIRVHAHQPADPTVYVRRDAIHPALRELIDIPAHFTLKCSQCGHDDPCQLLISVAPPSTDADPSVATSTTASLFSRSQSPQLGVGEEHISAERFNTNPAPRHEAAPLFTPPRSTSPDGASNTMQMDESTVAHAQSLLLLRTPVQTNITVQAPNIAHQSFEIQTPVQQQHDLAQTPHSAMSQTPHSGLTQVSHSTMMQASHLDQPVVYDSSCFPEFIHAAQNTTEQYVEANQAQSYHRVYQQSESTFTQAPPQPPSASTSSFQTQPSSPPQPFQPPSPAQSFCPPASMYQQTQQQQPNEYESAFYTSYNEISPDMYLPPHSHTQPTHQAQTQLHHLKPGSTTWRHAPHSSSMPTAVAAVLSSPSSAHPSTSTHSHHIPIEMDPSGPVHFLPAGQNSQRRRRRCVVCIGAGRGEDADRCGGRGNRNLCPWYQRHGSPENIMEIRNAKDVRSANVA